jgi:multidrug resistance protein MdtO
MTTAASISSFSWEHKIFEFLRQELAPSPTRWRATLRITLLCALGTACIMSLHIPNGEFLIIFFFAVSQPDAWASFRRARLRGIGTLVGGGLGILTVLICGDKPWLFFPFQALLFAVGLFLSVTTTIPYAIIIGLFTFVIVTPFEDVNPEAALRTALWRILLTWVGVVFGTIGQMVLWPEKPEKLLLLELAAHLRRSEVILERLLARRETSILPAPSLPSNISATVVAGQLDLLASAEAGASPLRRYHAQQIKLITDIELVFGMVVRLERTIHNQPDPVPLTETVRVRLKNILGEMARLRHAMKQGNPPAYDLDDSPAIADSENETVVSSILQKLERCLQQMPASMMFLKMEDDLSAGETGFDRIREPIAPGNVFTPAFSLSNIPAIQFSLKGALAGSLCYVLYQSLNWPGISTCVVTAMIVIQSSFGASVQKGLLRLIGAALGSVMAFGVITLVMPNMESVASVVVVLSIPFFVAGWIVTGSSKISYVGMQVGLVLALVLLNRLGPTTNLAPAGDRILGVFIGIVVMGFINLALWPNFAGKTLRTKLTEAIRALAKIPRGMAELAGVKNDLVAGQAHREIAAALTLYDESLHEFGSREAATEAERQKLLAVISRLQEIFLVLLAIDRRRNILNLHAVTVAWQQRLQMLDEAIARRLETLTDSSEKPGTAPDPDQSLADFTKAMVDPAALAETNETWPRKLAEISVVYADLIEAIKRLQADVRSASLISA